jgi:ATP-dependent Clp protease protease subunit
VHTLCVGNAWGEAALLLSSGKKGCRSALPSSSLMLKQPIQQFQGLQASDIQIKRLELRKIKDEYCSIMGKNCGKEAEVLEKDMSRSLYLTPDEAVDYGLIDNVLREDAANFMSGQQTPEWK